MEPSGVASTGIAGLDRTIDRLRLGDNVVWQVDAITDFEEVCAPFIARAIAEGRQVHRLRFGAGSPPGGSALVTGTIDEGDAPEGTPPPAGAAGSGDSGASPPSDGPAPHGTVTHWLDPAEGFEAFTTRVHRLIHELGATAYYVVDSLTALQDAWHSDAMVANFFAVTCPLLFQLDTVAYFCLVRGRHSTRTIATVRDTTQVLFELHHIDGRLYVHPLKVWARYSPTMFFPARLDGDEVRPITSSVEASRLFAAQDGRAALADPWASAVEEADRDGLVAMLVGPDTADRIGALCRRWMTREDLLAVARRVVGTGRIGGKSVGMLLARAVLAHFPGAPGPGGGLADRLEPHDSFFIGSDFFYSYVVANGWWQLRMRQKEPGHFLDAGAELHDRLLRGAFPPAMRDEFWRVLDHFGQSPIIVRSSSLLEDGYGNAFAGKYDSVFLANQGSPEDRERAFEQAVRQVYASSMSTEALAYRRDRGLEFRDEQMAILVQRVSGDQHTLPAGTLEGATSEGGAGAASEILFLPHAAGVANSSNLYTWSSDLDPDAGMLRLVVGLGTRAVNRTGHDYARVVALDAPLSGPAWDGQGGSASPRTTQRRVDALLLSGSAATGAAGPGGAERPGGAEAAVIARSVDRLRELGLGDDWRLFARPDEDARRRLRELGRDPGRAPDLVDFRGLLAPGTGFTAWMRAALSALRTAYDHPVDVEFTLNVDAAEPGGSWRVNIVQCRPLQTRGPSSSTGEVEVPDDPDDALVALHGHFMGGTAALPLTHVVLVRPRAYAELGTQDRHEVARRIGAVTAALREPPGGGEPASVLLLGPGRWGTTTPSLGVPSHFTEISSVAVLGELADGPGGFRPELSWGSHFFQDLVETGIFYLAIDPLDPGTALRLERVLARPNLVADLVPDAAPLAGVLHVADMRGGENAGRRGLELRADVTTQRLVIR